MAPLIAGNPKPAKSPIMEITTKSSTSVKEDSFRFGKFSRKDKFMIMTTPTPGTFHQPKSNVCRDPLFPKPVRLSAFTLVELLGVITIIGILAGLTLGAAGAVRRHGATSQAKAEIAALQAACERFFADNNAYPNNTSVNPSSSFSPTAYTSAGQTLFAALFGANQYGLPPSSKRYFEPKPSMVSSTNTANPYFVDPWGYAYGYNSDGTYAPLIWSTAGQTTGGANTNKWITSWPMK